MTSLNFTFTKEKPFEKWCKFHNIQDDVMKAGLNEIRKGNKAYIHLPEEEDEPCCPMDSAMAVQR